MARLRGIQATNTQTFAGTLASGFPVVLMESSVSENAPYVIEHVWLRVASGIGTLTSVSEFMCKTAAERFDVICRNIFRPAGADLSIFSDVATMTYSITIRWL
jgi:hypothetical protein